MNLSEFLVAAAVRIVPESDRPRYSRELTAEIAASDPPVRDAWSLLVSAPRLRRALLSTDEPVPLRCRLGRHEYERVLSDPDEPDAYWLRCLDCGHERDEAAPIGPQTREQQGAWMAGGGTEMVHTAQGSQSSGFLG